MKKTLALLASVAALAVVTPAFAADQEIKAETTIKKDDDGDYTAKNTVKKSDETGTVTREAKTDVDVDSDGEGKKTVTTKSVNDPKGLFNKKTTKTKSVTKLEDGKVTTENKKTVNGKTVVDSETK